MSEESTHIVIRSMNCFSCPFERQVFKTNEGVCEITLQLVDLLIRICHVTYLECIRRGGPELRLTNDDPVSRNAVSPVPQIERSYFPHILENERDTVR